MADRATDIAEAFVRRFKEITTRVPTLPPAPSDLSIKEEVKCLRKYLEHNVDPFGDQAYEDLMRQRINQLQELTKLHGYINEYWTRYCDPFPEDWADGLSIREQIAHCQKVLAETTDYMAALDAEGLIIELEELINLRSWISTRWLISCFIREIGPSAKSDPFDDIPF